MKIVSYGHAYVGTGWSAGGETTLHDLLSYLSRRGHDVTFILSEPARNGRDSFVLDGVQVCAYRDDSQPNRAIATADLVISHLGGAQRSSIIAKRYRVPSVHLIHNDQPYTMMMSRHAQYLVYNTNWVLEKFRDRRLWGGRYDRPPGIVVHPPVNPENYTVRSSRKYITLVNLSDGTDGHYDKGSKVFYALAERFPDEQFLAVKGAYGHQDIRNLPNVAVMEHTEDIREAYRKTKIILSPSKYESYGRVAIEAACSGIPSLSSDADGFKEHGIPAFYAPHDSIEPWVDNLNAVLLNTKTFAKSAKQAAHQLWDKSQGELESLERDLVVLANHWKRNFRR